MMQLDPIRTPPLEMPRGAEAIDGLPSFSWLWFSMKPPPQIPPSPLKSVVVPSDEMGKLLNCEEGDF
jgi:hypothetical protein